MNKQAVLQGIVLAIAVCGAVGTCGPLVTTLPTKWQPYGVAILSLAIVLEKILISCNQILVGPTKLQTAATQSALAEMPDKASPVLSFPTSSATTINTDKPISTTQQP